ncbi:MAG TPA: energy transducer TonB [Vicinamibacteria bacterium]|nr:energy transducer TonB [Vicinamibacteria bacterium]
MILLALNRIPAPARQVSTAVPVSPAAPAEAADPPRRVFLPRPEALATPAPPRPEAKDRISIGGPSPLRSREPLVLERERDITREVPRGTPDSQGLEGRQPGAAAAPAEAVPSAEAAPEAAPEALRLPPAPGGRDRSGPEPAPADRTIGGALRRLEDRLKGGDGGTLGAPTGTGQRFGSFHFDPQGADFTAWINQFKNEVYRNWIVPQSALLGAKGHVDIAFVVRRDGSLDSLVIAKSSGMPALDRAAANAILSSRLPPLPADYRPDRFPIEVTFFYNEAHS